MECNDLTAQERAAIVTWRLACGERLTTQEIMRLTGLTREGAWYLMMRLLRVVPIFCDDGGEWEKLDSRGEL